MSRDPLESVEVYSNVVEETYYRVLTFLINFITVIVLRREVDVSVESVGQLELPVMK